MSTGCATQVPLKLRRLSASVLLAALVLLVTGASCAGPRQSTLSSPEARAAALSSVADSYAQTGDLDAAKAGLNKLNVANPLQMLITLGEQEANEGRPPAEVQNIADLASALGVHSSKLTAYLAPTEAPPTEAPTEPPTPVPPATPLPTVAQAVPTVAASATVSNTATANPTALAAGKARVTAQNEVNLRSGPGSAYPVIGQINAGQALNILGRNTSGDWWRVAYPSEDQAWVAGVVIDVSGPIDTVAVMKNIPQAPVAVEATPAPVQVAVPAPAAAPTTPPTEAPKPSNGMKYVIKDFRLKPVGTDAQHCNGGDHNIWVYVQDAAGNRLDGVKVHEVFTNSAHATGSQGKGVGTALWDIYRGGGGQVDIVDDAGNRIGELSRGMSDDWPSVDLLWNAGYCGCKPYADIAACQAGLDNKAYTTFPIGHYVFEVTYQRVD